MNNKSRNTRAECGPFKIDDTTDNKFLRDYRDVIRPYVSNDLPGSIERGGSIEDLRRLAEQEFMRHYGSFPSCAVFAPGCLGIAGESTDFAEGKSLSMAVQLVTVIVGKRGRDGKWCHVKTLSSQVDGKKTFTFYPSTENLDVSAEGTSWIRYVKGTLQSFKAKRGYVPGFKIVIVSNVPVKRGLGSSSALVVATYTFLESITSTYVSNVFEKTLACHAAEKLATGPSGLRLSDVLACVVGTRDNLLAFDARSFRIEKCNWDTTSNVVLLVLVDTTETEETEESVRSNVKATPKEVSIVMNAMYRWRVSEPVDVSMMELLYSPEVMSTTEHVIDEDKRVSRMIDVVREGQWEELGKLLRENYYSARKYLRSLPNDIERIMIALEAIEGVLGARVISRGHGASVVVLVQRPSLQTLTDNLDRIKNSRYRYYVAEPSAGASTLYKYEDYSYPWSGRKIPSSRANLTARYHLRDDSQFTLDYYKTTIPTKSVSLFIPRGMFHD